MKYFDRTLMPAHQPVGDFAIAQSWPGFYLFFASLRLGVK